MEKKVIIPVPSDIERSAPEGRVTRRNLYTNSAQNKDISTKLQAVVDEAFKGELIYKEFVAFENIEQLHKAFSELMIRFDTRPDHYTKKDYQLLLSVIIGSIGFLQNNGGGGENDPLPPAVEKAVSEITDKLESVLEDVATTTESITEITSTLADYKAIIDEVVDTASKVDDSITEITTTLGEQSTAIDSVTNNIESIQQKVSDIETTIENLEITVEGGSGIEIKDNVVNAVVKEGFTTSISVGGIPAGTEIKDDKELVALLKDLLTKVIGCSFADSYVSTPNTTKYVEYGCDLVVNITASINQATAVSEDLENYNYNHTFTQSLESVNSDIWQWSIDENKTTAKGSTEYKIVTSSIKDQAVGAYTLSATSADDKAVNNQGEYLSFSPSTSGSIRGTIQVIPTLKCYIGAVNKPIDELTSDDITVLDGTNSVNLGTTKKSIQGTFTNVLNGVNSTFCIAAPQTMSLSKVIDDMGFDQRTSFTGTPVQVDIKQKNNTVYKYNVWVWKSSAPLVFNLIEF